MVLELIALLCTGIFAGAAIYISAVEHPARIECGITLALAQFRPSYRRAAAMQATLAAIGCLSAVSAWARGRGALVLLAGILLGAVIPFTLVVILRRPSDCWRRDSPPARSKPQRSWSAGAGSTRSAAPPAASRSCCSDSISSKGAFDDHREWTSRRAGCAARGLTEGGVRVASVSGRRGSREDSATRRDG
jgi:hypothetical protein